MGGAQQFEGARRQGVALFRPELPADIAVEVFGLEAGGVEDQAGGVAHFLADAISGQPGDAVARTTVAPCTEYLLSEIRNQAAGRPATRRRADRARRTGSMQFCVRLRISPAARSISSSSPAEQRCRGLLGETTAGRPRLMALRKKMRANDAAITAPAPANFSAAAACSRLEPQPKFFAATMNSPRPELRANLRVRQLEQVLGGLLAVGDVQIAAGIDEIGIDVIAQDGGHTAAQLQTSIRHGSTLL